MINMMMINFGGSEEREDERERGRSVTNIKQAGR